MITPLWIHFARFSSVCSPKNQSNMSLYQLVLSKYKKATLHKDGTLGKTLSIVTAKTFLFLESFLQRPVMARLPVSRSTNKSAMNYQPCSRLCLKVYLQVCLLVAFFTPNNSFVFTECNHIYPRLLKTEQT